MHLFGDPERYPPSTNATYQPPPAELADYDKVRRALGIGRSVFVQPSVYGADLRLLLDTIRLRPDRFAGIACIDTPLDIDAARKLYACGIRGVRINATAGRDAHVDAVIRSAQGLREANLSVSIAARDGNAVAIAQPFLEAGLNVVLDHFGMIDPGLPPASLDPLVRLLDGGHTWIKLTACYRVSRSGPPGFSDLGPMVQRLRDVRCDRLLWGSDWPHPDFPGILPNDESLMSALTGWGLRAAEQRMILVDNPVALFGMP